MIEFSEKSVPVLYIPEPPLGFGHGQASDHPKDGLTLYGPASKPDRPQITIGAVGTKHGLELLCRWLDAISNPVAIPPRGQRDKEFRLHLSDFPGLEEAFGIRANSGAMIKCEIEPADIRAAIAIENHHEAVATTTKLFIDPIERHAKNEERTVDVWIFVVPEIVFETCRPVAGQRRNVELLKGELSRRQKGRVDLPLLAGVIDDTLEAVFDDIPDFHRQVKAKLLKLGMTSQLIRETTLAPEEFVNKAGYPKRGTQDSATVAWNLATGLFYKTQAEPPWKIARMRPGVCYVGLVFKLLPNHADNHACCAAQMFLSEGDGVVFRGANGPWQTENREFHLSDLAAENLIKTVLDTYKQRFGTYPKELFIHGRTKFNDAEWEAFSKAAPDGTNIVGVRIQSTHGETKLFRDGDYPCLRGTAIQLGDKDAYLWTTGYAPRVDTYIGPETPNPLFVTVLRASGDYPSIETVLADILGLTKINYNACNFSDGLPVTIRFADKVGEVLTMGSATGAERQPFKFYV